MGYHSGKEVAIRLMLVRDYLEANATKKRAVSRKELEDYLAPKGFVFEKKTLYSDIQMLRDELGFQLKYDYRKGGYTLNNPPFEPYELRLMVDSIQSSKFITSPLADEISNKIKRLAGVDTRSKLERQAFVSDRVRSMNDSVVKDADRIYEAISTDRKIGFRYFHYSPDKENPKSYSKSGAQCIVSPFALSWNNGNFYLYAYDGKKFRYYRVDRMERISIPLPERREGLKEYQEKNLTSQKAKVFEMYSGPEYVVRLRIQNRLANAVIDQFGKDLIMVPDDESHFTVSVPVQVSPPFYAWVSTFGRGMKILSPAPAVDGMKEFLEKAASMYKDEGEK